MLLACAASPGGVGLLRDWLRFLMGKWAGRRAGGWMDRGKMASQRSGHKKAQQCESSSHLSEGCTAACYCLERRASRPASLPHPPQARACCPWLWWARCCSSRPLRCWCSMSCWYVSACEGSTTL